jgi:hypothetical protein
MTSKQRLSHTLVVSLHFPLLIHHRILICDLNIIATQTLMQRRDFSPTHARLILRAELERGGGTLQ